MSNFKPKNAYDVHVDEEFGITEAVATLDNGDFGSRTIRFETGQLARQVVEVVGDAGDAEQVLVGQAEMLLRHINAASPRRCPS